MADLMAGPGAPLTRAFISCGWRCITVDWLLDPSHDLAHPARQASLSAQLEEVIFIAAALDCSTKSRAREIPRVFEDGRPAPGPLRSEAHPDGLQGFHPKMPPVLTPTTGPATTCWARLTSCASAVRLWESGEWMETAYAACTLGGARCKQQLLRHNIEEIQQWPVAACHHVHDPEEWTPYTSEGRRVYPSKEEAEYTATLAYAIAVSASWWAARLGLAQLAVPRMPPFCATGRREHWLDLDPRALREWAMAPMAAMLGLTDALQETRPGLPVRGALEDAMVSTHVLKPGHLYVGRGSFQHRLSTTKWASPWTPGHNCEASEWLARYLIHVRTSNLWDALPELRGLRLVCDCPSHQLCEADILVGLYFDAAAPDARPEQRGTTGHWGRTVHLLHGIHSLPKAMSLPVMSQEAVEAVVLAFRKLFPGDWFKTFKFAMIEDLINSPPLCSYPAWLAANGEAWDGPLVPHMPSGIIRQTARIGEGLQVGAVTHRAALPPLLPFNLAPNEHFAQALQRAQQPLPHEDIPIADADLRFAADAYLPGSSSLRTWRQQAVGTLRELKRRWKGVTLHLCHFQEPALHHVVKQRDIGLLALLMILTSWADTSLPYGLVKGLPAVGYAPPMASSLNRGRPY
eukprot:s597_g45.t1